MKKILIGATAAAALILSFGAGASAAPGFNPSDYCKNLVPADGGFSHGDCTKIVAKAVNKSGSDDPATICQDLKLEDPAFFDANWKNLGECVTSFH